MHLNVSPADCIYCDSFPQRDWVNEYHRKCREVVGAELERQGRKEALEWLTRETQPIA